MTTVKTSGAPLTRGQLARRTSCNIETIRYYEKIGLLPEPRRSSGGHRLYDDPAAARLTFVLRSRELGFSLDQVRELLLLADRENDSCEQVKAITLNHVVDIRKRIVDLRKMERVLKELAGRCDAGVVPECPIVHSLMQSSANPS
ncbi:MAG: helix-turn-helix domain-containing protein [Alphaproteobacteria bacterium]